MPSPPFLCQLFKKLNFYFPAPAVSIAKARKMAMEMFAGRFQAVKGGGPQPVPTVWTHLLAKCIEHARLTGRAGMRWVEGITRLPQAEILETND